LQQSECENGYLDQFDYENGRIAVDSKPQNENSIARSIRGCVANMPGVWVFGAQMMCKDTGKEVKSSCCCTVKDGKFVCKFSNKTHDTCCCEIKS
jgi:hypothetical protein